MDQKLFSKLNLYDQIGYLMVGAVALIVLVFDVSHFYNTNIPPFTLDTFLIWFVVVYFAGHFTQAIVNLVNDTPLLRRLMKEDKGNFNEREKEILERARILFKLEKQDDDRIWSICYALATAKDITGQVQVFNANYSLYRGWFMIFFFQSAFLVYLLFMRQDIIVFLILSVIVAVVFNRRARRFWCYLRNKVFDTFVIVQQN